MQITVNGEGREVAEGITIRGLIELLELRGGPVAVEKNGEVIPRAEHAATVIAGKDVIEIVHFVGGG
jgi:sulfur carrier protein